MQLQQFERGVKSNRSLIGKEQFLNVSNFEYLIDPSSKMRDRRQIDSIFGDRIFFCGKNLI